MISAKEKRLTKNTVFLYGRTVLTMLITLYTSRVVLEKLGASDFGVFNLVAGFVTIFSFLQGSASSATLRFLTFELGARNHERLRHTFSTALAIHLVLCGIVFVLAETVGLWFVNTQLDIAPERMVAANWVYQTAIVTALATVIQIPYSAATMAHERLDVYAVLMLSQAFLRLGVALMLVFMPFTDNLISYALMYMGCTVLVTIGFAVYSVKSFRECRTMPHFEKGITRALLSFSGFDTFGNFSSLCRIQGINVIINRFGGTVLNAGAALATQVTGALTQFSSTILLAFKPQITKEYATQNYSRVVNLVTASARYSFLMVAVLAVPIFTEIDYVLHLWLGNDVPAWTAAFCRICVISACVEAVNGATAAGIHATGRIVSLSLLCGLLALGELPAAYFLLRSTDIPSVVYAVHLVFVVIIMVTEAAILYHQLSTFRPGKYILKAFVVPVLIAMLPFCGCIVVSEFMEQSFGRLCLCCAISLVFITVLTYAFMLEPDTRRSILNYVKGKFVRNKQSD